MVAIGVLALLAAVTLATLRRVSHTSGLTLCASNVRQVHLATESMRQATSYVQPAGFSVPVQTPWGGSLPTQFMDPDQRRYAWLKAGFAAGTDHFLMDLPKALVQYGLTQEVLHCPRAPGESFSGPRGHYLTPEGVASQALGATSSFIPNASVFALRTDRSYRVSGRLHRVVEPSRVVLYFDSNNGLGSTESHLNLEPVGLGDGPLTLSELLESGPVPFGSAFRQHGGRANVGFADGHVTAVREGSGELRAVLYRAHRSP